MEIGLSEVIKFAQENWLSGLTSCLHWKWLICFRIWWQNFPQKMWVLRFQDLQFLWIIGHSWSPKIKYCMSGKHNSVNLSISAGRLNLLPNFQKKKKLGKGRLDMNTNFRWGLLGKIGVRFFRMGVGVQFLYIDKLKWWGLRIKEISYYGGSLKNLTFSVESQKSNI